MLDAVKRTAAQAKARASNAEVAFGTVIIRNPRFAAWVCLILALAGAKLLTSGLR